MVHCNGGRYSWGHDRVLQSLADVLEKERVDKKDQKESTKTIYSVCQARRETKYTIEEGKGILDCAESWEMRTGWKNKLVFSEIVQTTLRPDIVIWSQQSKKLIAIELTVPWKERCQ